MTRNARLSSSLVALRLLALLLLSLLVTSCGDSRFKKVYPVKGRVLVDGKPAEGVTVRFTSLDDPGDEHAAPSAKTDDNGWFIVSTYKKDDGVPAGSYAVSMVWVPAGFRGPIERGNKLPERYSKPETSGMKVEIAAKENVLSPFELEKK